MKRRKTPLIVGHRGSRGLKPENTVKAFQKVIELGARALEMDLFITKDGRVMVTHDATISPDLCSKPSGEPVAAQEQLKIYDFRVEEIKPYYCGSEPNPHFPQQENTEAHIPLLEEVIQQATSYAGKGEEPIRLFVEFKSDKTTDNIYHPEPRFFVERSLKALEEQNALEQAVLLSFDKRCLQEARGQRPDIKIGVSFKKTERVQEELDALGFLPDVLCPLHRELTGDLLQLASEHALEVIPWTVNEEEDIRKMIKWKVDGIINDYPDKARKLIRESS